MSYRPIEVPWGVKEAAAVFVMAWIGLPLLLIIALNQLSFIPSVAEFLTAYAEGKTLQNFIFAVAYALAALAAVGYYLHRYRVSWGAVGMRRFDLVRTMLYLVIGIIVFFVAIAGLFALLQALVPGFNASEEQVNEFTKAATEPGTRRLAFIALVLIPPVEEEIVFRGFIFPALSKRRGVVFGAFITSLLFGLAHLQSNVGVYTIMLSLILCLMYYKLRSIIPGIMLHMLNNYLAFIALTGSK